VFDCARKARTNTQVFFRLPFLLAAVFYRPEIYSQRTEIGRAGRLRCACKDIGAPGDFKIGKTGGCDRSLKLRFQQSTGNSTRP
jgi:hypothetical protein